MKLQTHRHFKRYTPDRIGPGFPEGTHFICDELGNDWYDVRDHYQKSTAKVIFDESRDNRIVMLGYDAERLWPIDYSISEIPADKVPADFAVGPGWAFHDGEIVPCKAQAREEIKRQIDSEIYLASQEIEHLHDLEVIGQITSELKKKMILWRTYRVRLREMDPSQYPAEFPQKPQ